MKSQSDQIDRLLKANAEEIQPEWIGAAISSAALTEESERLWRTYMEVFVVNLRQHGIEPRPEIVASKEKVFEGWRLKREILFRHHAATPSRRLYRFDGGEGNPCGYVLLDGKNPVRCLTVRINRPDPNIGNVRLPFP